MEQTVRECLGNGVVHQRERGVAADEALLGLAAEDLGEQPLRRGQAGQLAVVAHVDTVGNIVFGGLENVHDIADHIELGAAGLAAGHIQLQLARFERVKLGLYRAVFFLQLRCAAILVCNSHFPYLSYFSF